MRLALVLCIVLALMTPAQSFAAMPAHDGPADEIAATRSQQEDQTKKKKDEKKKDSEKEKGTLDTFESEATDKKAKAPVDSLQTVELDEDDGNFLVFIGEVFLFAVAIGTVGSWYRVTGQPKGARICGCNRSRE
jgi:hypothetical protein